VPDDLRWELMTGIGDRLHTPTLSPPSAIRVTTPPELHILEGNRSEQVGCFTERDSPRGCFLRASEASSGSK
jgi:hypothetical protein